jgi:dTDP-4-dehydrorhamnose reductase
VKVLVLGGGQIATAVTRSAPSQYKVVCLSRAQLDIVDASAVARTLEEVKADWVINGAAFTAVDRAEVEKAEAKAVNDTAVGSLATSVERIDSKLLHLSTDFVFDGQSNKAYLPCDRTNPLNVYGSTKLCGEKHVLASPTHVVLRTSWVYASTGKNFVLTMLRLMKDREQINVVHDQIGAPTWAGSVAEAIWACVGADIQGGIYHWSDLGVATWYDFAVAIHEEALQRGFLPRPVRVVPIPSSAYPTPAKRPAFSVLDTSATRSVLRIPGQHWRQNLRTMMDEIRTA